MTVASKIGINMQAQSHPMMTGLVGMIPGRQRGDRYGVNPGMFPRATLKKTYIDLLERYRRIQQHCGSGDFELDLGRRKHVRCHRVAQGKV